MLYIWTLLIWAVRWPTVFVQIIPHGYKDSKSSGDRNATTILSQLLTNYDRKLRPQAYGRAVEVIIDIAILNIDSISEKRMEYSMLCYFRQLWFDERLRFKSEYKVLPVNAQRTLTEIWRPDTYIRNGKHSYIHKLTVPNSLLRLRNDGGILLSQRFTIKARCLMHLKKFPMDKQRCPLEIGSLGYPESDVVYRWKNIIVAEDVAMSQFGIGDIEKEILTVPSVQNAEESFSVLVAHLNLIRQQGYFILQIYVPCSMMVAMSWVSFWLNREAAIARCSLGMITVLTLITLRQSVREELPTVEYSTALDVFLFVSFGFVVAALVEYIVIHFANLSSARSKIKPRIGRMMDWKMRRFSRTGEEDMRRRPSALARHLGGFRRSILRRQSSIYDEAEQESNTNDLILFQIISTTRYKFMHSS